MQMGATAVNWLPLADATTIMDHDVQRARESLERAISKAWLVGPGGTPQVAVDPNVPLRIQVTPSSGWRLVGRAWLDQPVLDWETSEIECLCAPWTPSRQSQPPASPTQSRARIAIWRDDIVRLWGGSGTLASNLPAVGGSGSAARQPMQEDRSADATLKLLNSSQSQARSSGSSTC